MSADAGIGCFGARAIRRSSGTPCERNPSVMICACVSCSFHAYQREKPGPSA
jgi:hypothetical protein